MFRVDYSIKKFFVDRQKIADRATRASVRALGKAGAFLRQTARKDILRKRKKPSKAGQPPSVHSTDSVETLRNILFGVDASKPSLIVGPVGLNKLISGRTVPNILEFGGTVGIREKLVGKRWRSVGRRQARPGQPTRVRQATYAPRPFMGPALKKEREKLPGLWKATVNE